MFIFLPIITCCLVAFKGSFEKYFTDHPPSSISEAAAKIKELTGIERKETQVRKFLKSMGFRCLQVGVVPAKAMTEEKKRTKGIFGQRTSTTIRRSQTWQTYCLSSFFYVIETNKFLIR